MLLAPDLHLRRDFLGGARVPKTGSPNLDGGRAGQHELDHIRGRRNATHSDDRNLHRLRCFVDHAHCNGFNSWSGESGSNVGDTRLARLNVNRHGNKRIYQRDRVRASLLRHMRHLADAGHVGGKFNDQWPLRKPPCGGDHFVERAGIAAELNPSVCSVRTRYVQFIRGNALAFIHNLDGVFVVFAGITEDVGDDDGVFDRAKFGQLAVNKRPGADVLQSDGVQHTGGGLVKAWRRIANKGFARQPLDHEAPQPLQVDYVFELNPVTKSAAGGDDGILQLDTGQADTEVGSHAAISLV